MFCSQSNLNKTVTNPLELVSSFVTLGYEHLSQKKAMLDYICVSPETSSSVEWIWTEQGHVPYSTLRPDMQSPSQGLFEADIHLMPRPM